MKFCCILNSQLLPYLDKLLLNCPNEVDYFLLPDEKIKTEAVISSSVDFKIYDGLIFTDGMDRLQECPVLSENIKIAVPLVHNFVSLLLGNPNKYCHLLSQFDGGVCWRLPNSETIYFTPKKDCNVLCYVADCELGLSDDSIKARKTAQQNELDFMQTESNVSLLKDLLWGRWDNENIAVISSNDLDCKESEWKIQ